ncbi:MAG: MBL fold metallo-hydrolase [Phycisphaerales bacterium]|nr:MBL fold metallo-hydrolase [Phycisphaerales bacterium]
MSMAFAVLGSGSRGNCSVVRLESGPRPRYLLIDAGLSQRQTIKRLESLRIRPDQVSDLLLTHLDRDHFHHAWASGCEKFGIRAHVHRRHRTEALRAGLSARRARFFDDDFTLGDDAAVETIHLAHDDVGSIGYVIEHDGHRLGWATDLGRVTPSLFARFHSLHAIAMESNYDRAMQLASERHWRLKRRIMGGAGHLSNDQCLDAVRRIAETSRLSRIVLLHLSQDCNDPTIVQRLYVERAPELLDQLTLSHQTTPTGMLRVERSDEVMPDPRPRTGEQLLMFEVC